MEMSDPLIDEISGNVNHFLSHTKCWFHPRDIWSEHNISSEDGKRYLRELLEERVTDGILQHEGQTYRLINKELKKINWFDANEDDYIKLILPFNLHKYVKLFAGVVLIAGESGMGKSAFIWDCIFRNLSSDMPQNIFVSDALAVEIKERVLGLCDHYDRSLPTDNELKVWERHSKFGDVIENGGINYIDYLDLSSDFYRIGQEIEDIQIATGDGLTFVAIQKNPKEHAGLGGWLSVKNPQLYITLSTAPPELNIELHPDNGWQCQLRVSKSRGLIDKAKPAKGKKWCYDIKEGCKFSVETGNGG